MSLHSTIAILYKDLIDIIRSKTVWINLSLPIVMSLFFGLAFSRTELLPSIGLCDKGKSGFKDFLKKTGVFTVKEIDSDKNAEELLEKDNCSLVLILPSDFDSKLKNKDKPKVNIMIDEKISDQSKVLFIGLGEIFRNYAGQKYPVAMELKKINKNKLDHRQTLLPMWILITLMSTLVITTASLIEEKEKKTLYALLVSPASIYDVVIGKALMGVILTIISASILLLLNGGFTGNILSIFLILFSGALCFSFAGILIALISPAQTTANAINSLILISLTFPVVLSNNSRVLYVISRFLPSYYLVDGIKKSMAGDFTLESLSMNYIFLSGLSVFLFLICLRVISLQEN